MSVPTNTGSRAVQLGRAAPAPQGETEPEWARDRALKPGDRVRLTDDGRAAGLRPKTTTGVVAGIYALSADYVDVRLDGRKFAGTWAARFWERAE